MTRPSTLHVLLSGGGSGGHVFPALAVGEALAERGCAVSFAGSPRGMEARLVPERGVRFHPLRARPLVGRGPVDRAVALATLALSAVAGALLVRRLGARVVLGTGGYACAPAVLGARLARRPALLLEPNARAGFANRKLSRFAAGAAVAFGRAGGELACPTRTTGVPVRRDFFGVARELPAGGPNVLVLGGSQGARVLNRSLPAALGGPETLFERLPGLTVVHQTGVDHLESTRAAYEAAGAPADRVRLVPFIDDVAAAMEKSHLIVSRAGAITVAEITAAGRASLLVPLSLAEGHQEDNARALEQAGAARALLASELEPRSGAGPETAGRRVDAARVSTLRAALEELLGDRNLLGRMAEAARSLARPDAASDIADWVLELGGVEAPAAVSTEGGRP